MTNDIENKVIKLKAEVYDVIRQQEQLANQNSVLQDKKIRIAQEIQILESQLVIDAKIAKP